MTKHSLPHGAKEINFQVIGDVKERLSKDDAACEESAAATRSPRQAKFDDVSATVRRLKRIDTALICEQLEGFKETIDAEANAAAFQGMVRKEFIASHLVLNARVGCKVDPAPAPAFRPQPNRTRFPAGNAAALSNIIRLIDMHYCWSMGHKPRQTGKIATAFGEQFDFEEAYEFSQSKGKIAAKLELIGLDETPGPGYCRIGNASLKTDAEREAHRCFLKSRDRFLIDLRNKSLKASVNEDEWADMLAAAGLLKKFDLDASGQNLKLVLCLVGRVSDDAPYRVMQKYTSACRTLGVEP
ncbi:hypothetical protein [Labrenzia sp. VG12]|uniref:hypothetical protein n=1 Tax=Labrenzia sp. VG12 TaxID=2021862 RepID=UPI000B8C4A98|nr:hypothetical protein [Labrenzia sp. VG12]ASP34089.1 hypothetical protein CHH27_13240 [Labrenzia sp. VG12]